MLVVEGSDADVDDGIADTVVSEVATAVPSRRVVGNSAE